MSMVSTNEGYDAYHILEAVAWNDIGAKNLVIWGGGDGSASISLAERVEAIKCIDQDLPEVHGRSVEVATTFERSNQ